VKIYPQSLILNNRSSSFTFQLQTDFVPGGSETLNWISSNSDVVSVDSSGLLTIKEPGRVIISAKSSVSGDVLDDINVKVVSSSRFPSYIKLENFGPFETKTVNLVNDSNIILNPVIIYSDGHFDSEYSNFTFDIDGWLVKGEDLIDQSLNRLVKKISGLHHGLSEIAVKYKNLPDLSWTYKVRVIGPESISVKIKKSENDTLSFDHDSGNNIKIDVGSSLFLDATAKWTDDYTDKVSVISNDTNLISVTNNTINAISASNIVYHPHNLPENVTSIVDINGQLYVSVGKNIYRYSLSGGLDLLYEHSNQIQFMASLPPDRIYFSSMVGETTRIFYIYPDDLSIGVVNIKILSDRLTGMTIGKDNILYLSTRGVTSNIFILSPHEFQLSGSIRSDVTVNHSVKYMTIGSSNTLYLINQSGKVFEYKSRVSTEIDSNISADAAVYYEGSLYLFKNNSGKVKANRIDFGTNGSKVIKNLGNISDGYYIYNAFSVPDIYMILKSVPNSENVESSIGSVVIPTPPIQSPETSDPPTPPRGVETVKPLSLPVSLLDAVVEKIANWDPLNNKVILKIQHSKDNSTYLYLTAEVLPEFSAVPVSLNIPNKNISMQVGSTVDISPTVLYSNSQTDSRVDVIGYSDYVIGIAGNVITAKKRGYSFVSLMPLNSNNLVSTLLVDTNPLPVSFVIEPENRVISDKITITNGDIVDISVFVKYNDDGLNTDFDYTLGSNSQIIDFTNQRITAKSVGDTKITFRSKNTIGNIITYDLNVKVIPIRAPVSITISERVASGIPIVYNQTTGWSTIKLHASVTYTIGQSDSKVYWVSSDPEKFPISVNSDGSVDVTANFNVLDYPENSVPEAEITATSWDDTNIISKVKVILTLSLSNPIPVSLSVLQNLDSLPIKYGTLSSKKFDIRLVVINTDGTRSSNVVGDDSNVSWVSGDTRIVSVGSNGLLIPGRSGIVDLKVIAKYNQDLVKYIPVEVDGPLSISVKDIPWNPLEQDLYLDVDSTFTINSEVLFKDGTKNTDVVFSNVSEDMLILDTTGTNKTIIAKIAATMSKMFISAFELQGISADQDGGVYGYIGTIITDVMRITENNFKLFKNAPLSISGIIGISSDKVILYKHIGNSTNAKTELYKLNDQESFVKWGTVNGRILSGVFFDNYLYISRDTGLSRISLKSKVKVADNTLDYALANLLTFNNTNQKPWIVMNRSGDGGICGVTQDGASYWLDPNKPAGRNLAKLTNSNTVIITSGFELAIDSVDSSKYSLVKNKLKLGNLAKNNYYTYTADKMLYILSSDKKTLFSVDVSKSKAKVKIAARVDPDTYLEFPVTIMPKGSSLPFFMTVNVTKGRSVIDIEKEKLHIAGGGNPSDTVTLNPKLWISNSTTSTVIADFTIGEIVNTGSLPKSTINNFSVTFNKPQLVPIFIRSKKNSSVIKYLDFSILVPVDHLEVLNVTDKVTIGSSQYDKIKISQDKYIPLDVDVVYTDGTRDKRFLVTDPNNPPLVEILGDGAVICGTQVTESPTRLVVSSKQDTSKVLILYVDILPPTFKEISGVKLPVYLTLNEKSSTESLSSDIWFSEVWYTDGTHNPLKNEGYLDSSSGIKAIFKNPTGLAIDVDGNLIVCDTDNNVIRKITVAGLVTTVAGSGTAGLKDGNSILAEFNKPEGVVVKDNKIYVSDTGNHAIREIDINGNVTTILGNGLQGSSNIVTTQIDSLDPKGIFNNPRGLAFDSLGNLYVADSYNYKIRKISFLSGSVSNISDFAGSSEPGNLAGVGSSAKFMYPVGLTISNSDLMYVADAGSNNIKKIDVSGNVTILTYTFGGNLFEIPDNYSFYNINDLVISSTGILYISDTNNCVIRKMSSSNVLSNFAGNGNGFINGKKEESKFSYPRGIVISKDGSSLYVSDSVNNIIRKIIINAVDSTAVTSLAGGLWSSSNDTMAVGQGPNIYSLLPSLKDTPVTLTLNMDNITKTLPVTVNVVYTGIEISIARQRIVADPTGNYKVDINIKVLTKHGEISKDLYPNIKFETSDPEVAVVVEDTPHTFKLKVLKTEKFFIKAIIDVDGFRHFTSRLDLEGISKIIESIKFLSGDSSTPIEQRVEKLVGFQKTNTAVTYIPTIFYNDDSSVDTGIGVDFIITNPNNSQIIIQDITSKNKISATALKGKATLTAKVLPENIQTTLQIVTYPDGTDLVSRYNSNSIPLTIGVNVPISIYHDYGSYEDNIDRIQDREYITFTSSDTTVVTIDSSGTMLGIKEGTSTITAKSLILDKTITIIISTTPNIVPFQVTSIDDKVTLRQKDKYKPSLSIQKSNGSFDTVADFSKIEIIYVDEDSKDITTSDAGSTERKPPKIETAKVFDVNLYKLKLDRISTLEGLNINKVTNTTKEKDYVLAGLSIDGSIITLSKDKNTSIGINSSDAINVSYSYKETKIPKYLSFDKTTEDTVLGKDWFKINNVSAPNPLISKRVKSIIYSKDYPEATACIINFDIIFVKDLKIRGIPKLDTGNFERREINPGVTLYATFEVFYSKFLSTDSDYIDSAVDVLNISSINLLADNTGKIKGISLSSSDTEITYAAKHDNSVKAIFPVGVTSGLSVFYVFIDDDTGSGIIDLVTKRLTELVATVAYSDGAVIRNGRGIAGPVTWSSTSPTMSENTTPTISIDRSTGVFVIPLGIGEAKITASASVRIPSSTAKAEVLVQNEEPKYISFDPRLLELDVGSTFSDLIPVVRDYYGKVIVALADLIKNDTIKSSSNVKVTDLGGKFKIEPDFCFNLETSNPGTNISDQKFSTTVYASGIGLFSFTDTSNPEIYFSIVDFYKIPFVPTDGRKYLEGVFNSNKFYMITKDDSKIDIFDIKFNSINKVSVLYPQVEFNKIVSISNYDSQTLLLSYVNGTNNTRFCLFSINTQAVFPFGKTDKAITNVVKSNNDDLFGLVQVNGKNVLAIYKNISELDNNTDSFIKMSYSVNNTVKYIEVDSFVYYGNNIIYGFKNDSNKVKMTRIKLSDDYKVLPVEEDLGYVPGMSGVKCSVKADNNVIVMGSKISDLKKDIIVDINVEDDTAKLWFFYEKDTNVFGVYNVKILPRNTKKAYMIDIEQNPKYVVTKTNEQFDIVAKTYLSDGSMSGDVAASVSEEFLSGPEYNSVDPTKRNIVFRAKFKNTVTNIKLTQTGKTNPYLDVPVNIKLWPKSISVTSEFIVSNTLEIDIGSTLPIDIKALYSNNSTGTNLIELIGSEYNIDYDYRYDKNKIKISGGNITIDESMTISTDPETVNIEIFVKDDLSKKYDLVCKIWPKGSAKVIKVKPSIESSTTNPISLDSRATLELGANVYYSDGTINSFVFFDKSNESNESLVRIQGNLIEGVNSGKSGIVRAVSIKDINKSANFHVSITSGYGGIDFYVE